MPLAIRRHSYINRYLMLIKNGRLQGLGLVKLPALIVYEAALTAYFLIKDPRRSRWLDYDEASYSACIPQGSYSEGNAAASRPARSIR